MTNEHYRKIIHLSSLWIAILYHFTNFYTMLMTVCISNILMLIFEYLRLGEYKYKEYVLKILYYRYLEPILRPHEKNHITGACYMVFAALICIIIVTKEVFILAFSILAISDSMAAIVGKACGKIKLGKKTLEGSITFFITSLIISYAAFYLYNTEIKFLVSAIISCIFTTLAELSAEYLKLDDNIIIPLIFSITFVITNKICLYL